MSKQPPPAPTASAIGPCPTIAKLVGRPGTESMLEGQLVNGVTFFTDESRILLRRSDGHVRVFRRLREHFSDIV